VSLPLFSGFKRPARTAQRRAAVELVRTQYELASSRAEAEVKSLLDAVAEARARSRAQRLALRQAERGYEIARAQYREGLGSQIEITDAEVALRQSEFNHAEAVYDYLSAAARLEAAIGLVPELESGRKPVLGNEGGRP
jgi:outer membrane protein TolC